MSNVFSPGVSADSPNTADGPWTADSGAGFYVNLPNLAATDFAARLLRLFPRGWLSDSAQAPGGAAYGTFLGIGTPLASLLAQTLFIANGIRVKTAYGTALDIISVDYFGPNGLPRNPGESDTSFRTRILQMLLIPRVTRAAIQNAVKILTGNAPRMAEPWTAGGDCAALDLNSYLGVDGTENIAPGRIGDALIYTGFMDVSIPVSSVTGGYPIYGIDIGAALDVGTTALGIANLATNVTPVTGYESQVMEQIQAFKAWGITVGVRFTASGALSNTVSGSVLVPSGSTLLQQENEGVSFTMQSWLQAFGVWTEVLPWQASTYISQRGISFTVTASAAAASASTVGWTAAIFKGPTPTALRVPVKSGQSSLTCVLAIPDGMVPIIMPDWSTIPYVTALTPASIGLSVSNAGSGNLDIILMSGSAASVAASASSVTVDATLPSSYALYATPSWATTLSVAKTGTSFTLTFGTAAPSGGGTVYWSAQPN